MNKINDKPIIILGSGGHAKVVADTLKLLGKQVLGFVTNDNDSLKKILDINILGDDSILDKYSNIDVDLANGIGSIPYDVTRWDVAKRMRNKDFRFPTFIHPTAFISSDVSLDEGVQIMAGATIQTGTSIGMDTIINTAVAIDHDCSIGKNCHLAPGTVCSGGVSIKRGVHIGTGSVIIQNITIGKDTNIAAGSTLYKDVKSNITLFKN